MGVTNARDLLVVRWEGFDLAEAGKDQCPAIWLASDGGPVLRGQNGPLRVSCKDFAVTTSAAELKYARRDATQARAYGRRDRDLKGAANSSVTDR